MADCLTPKQIDDLVANRLSLEDRQSAAEHIQSCDKCRRELEAHHHDDRSAGDTKATDPKASSLTSVDMSSWMHPDHIGPYVIRQKLGEGGMGVVYLADQTAPIRRQVALKLIKFGMDTRTVIARFEAERQALALMNHPNVAGVLDAGSTEQGRPYFVMEYVRGIPITDYCDRHLLTTRQRLRLLIPVCEAVQHAHLKGIIHRDIKPSNVLVAVEGDQAVPKVIDFGVARATQHRLTAETMFTEQGQLIGTPEYMSPEQAEMTALDIDTRTDIYSLGVLLYELLVGALPFDASSLRQAGFGEIQRIIREVDLPKPSARLSSLGEESTIAAQKRHTDRTSLRRQLRGDLDWITMKAIDKDRTRRYDTANALALDIQRYLTHQPVSATPPSTLYRLKKLIRRKPRTVAAVSAIILIAAAGVVTNTLERRRSDAARQAVAKVIGVVAEMSPSPQARAGQAEEGIALLGEAIERVHAVELTSELPILYALRCKLHQLVGDELHDRGEHHAAMQDCQEALELDPGESLALRTVAYLQLSAEEPQFEEALDNYNKGLRDDMGFSEDYHNRARLLRIADKPAAALEDHNQAIGLLHTVGLAISYMSRGVTHRFLNDPEKAVADFAMAQSLDPSSRVQSNLLIWETRMLQGDSEAADAALQSAVQAAQDAQDPTDRLCTGICTGELTAEQALAKARNNPSRFWACYYLGSRALVNNDRDNARRFFQECRQVGYCNAPEYDLAAMHLQHLGED